MGDGETGHGTSLQNITLSTIKKNETIEQIYHGHKIPIKSWFIINHTILNKQTIKQLYITLYPDYHKIRISEQGVVKWGGRTCLLIGRDQPKAVLPNMFWNVGVD